MISIGSKHSLRGVRRKKAIDILTMENLGICSNWRERLEAHDELEKIQVEEEAKTYI